MLHVVNPDLMRAMARHHPDGRPKDPHEDHRRTVAEARRLARRAAFAALLRRLARVLPVPQGAPRLADPPRGQATCKALST